MKAAETAFQTKRPDQLDLLMNKAGRDQILLQVVQSYQAKLNSK